jgi:hypothetical protein
VHTREGHRPDLGDCPRAKLRRGSPELGIGGARGCLLVEDATESYFEAFKLATLEMVRAQGGIVGWTAPSAALAPDGWRVAGRQVLVGRPLPRSPRIWLTRLSCSEQAIAWWLKRPRNFRAVCARARTRASSRVLTQNGPGCWQNQDRHAHTAVAEAGAPAETSKLMAGRPWGGRTALHNCAPAVGRVSTGPYLPLSFTSS